MKSKTKDIVFIALSTAVMIVCAFITVPFQIPFTMQTFAVFTIIGLLGTKRAFISVCIYLLLGTVGLPVFSGFRGGLGHLLGATGGYLIGFLLTALVSGALLHLLTTKKFSVIRYILAMIPGLFVCYLFGTLWFYFVYTSNTGSITFAYVLSVCVVPFILPDLVKIGLASCIVKLLRNRINNL